MAETSRNMQSMPKKNSTKTTVTEIKTAEILYYYLFRSVDPIGKVYISESIIYVRLLASFANNVLLLLLEAT